MSRRVLIVEDDAALARVLCHNLKIDGFEVAWTSDGAAAPALARTFVPDVVLLDIMLPGRSGFELCSVLRQGGRTPVIFLTVRADKQDKVRSFSLGADDYVTKPFDMEELVARIHAVLRRVHRPVVRVRMGAVHVDFQNRRATDSGRDLHLTHREFEVLRVLVMHEGHVVYRDELLRQIWGLLDGETTRSVDQAIARLRKKIERDPGNPQFIQTVRGDGYCLTLPESDAPE